MEKRGFTERDTMSAPLTCIIPCETRTVGIALTTIIYTRLAERQVNRWKEVEQRLQVFFRLASFCEESFQMYGQTRSKLHNTGPEFEIRSAKIKLT